MNKEIRLNDIVILRAISIILVVFVHCYYIYNYGILSDIETVDLTNLRIINLDILGRFRMPMFIFISGFLFSFLHYEKHKYPKFTDLLSNKFKRLLIPYCVFFPVTAWSLGLFEQDSHINILYPIGHLWFLLMLFWCFIFTKMIISCKIDNKYFIGMIIVLAYIFAFISHLFPDILGLNDFANKYIYFFVGFICYKYDNILKLRNTSKLRICFLMLGAIVFQLCCIILYSSSHTTWMRLISPATSLLIVLSCYALVNRLLNSRIIANKPIFEKINKCSYGIYVSHPWIIDFITSKSEIILVAKVYTMIFLLLLFAVVLVLSVTFTRLLLTCKVGRFLIG